MKVRIFWKTMMAVAVLTLWVSTAMPLCVSNVPAVLHRGESACIQVCADDFGYDPIELVGTRPGIESLPVLIFTPGCNSSNSDCDVQCVPVPELPVWPTGFEYGGDPNYPDHWYAETDCFWMYFRWGHLPATWYLEIYTLCDGCFCLTFDTQLPVTMSSQIAALPGDNSVTLTWATASEASNERFDISRNGHVIGSVQGLVNSATGRTYRFTDETVQNGVEYEYTLESVDVNGGRYEVGTVTATPAARADGAVTDYHLYQNYPNPFNPATRLAFDVPVTANVTLKVYNPMGAEVATLVNREMNPGHHFVEFDGTQMTSGLYFYSIQVGDAYKATRKMLLVK